MAEPSTQLSLFRNPAVIAAVAGILAGYGIYASANAFRSATASTSTSLQRSNALHRPRRDRLQTSVNIIPRAEYPPLGALSIKKGDIYMVLDLVTLPMPSCDRLREVFGPDTAAERIQQESAAAVLGAMARLCLDALDNPDMRAVIESLGFGMLSDAISSGDTGRIRESASIAAQRHWPDIGPAPFEAAIEDFIDEGEYPIAMYPTPRMQVDGDSAETDGGIPAAGPDTSQGLNQVLYHTAEEDARTKAHVHRGVNCNACDAVIRGIRWHCLNCPSYDLCSTCEQVVTHIKTHVFAKVKIPFPAIAQPRGGLPSLYPGGSFHTFPDLDRELKEKLCRQFDLDPMDLDAHYDFFASIADQSWTEDPCRIGIGISRMAIYKVLTRPHWPTSFFNNLIYRRTFDFYDPNANGVIGFWDFMKGLQYVRGLRRFESLDPAVEGYDLDGDGFIARLDFLEMLSAKFQFHEYLVFDMVRNVELEQTRGDDEVIDSARPISAAFNSESVPYDEHRRSHVKEQNAFGDLQAAPGTATILHDADAWSDTGSPIASPGRTQGVWDNVSVRMLIDQANNELLDKIFLEREREDQAAIDTRPERGRWRTLIDGRSARSGIDGLDLEDVRNSTDSPRGPVSGDPTLPHNRPDHSLQLRPDVPTYDRIEYLARMDEQDRALCDRGGPGRLSCKEISDMALADHTKAILGLVKCWLEFANF